MNFLPYRYQQKGGILVHEDLHLRQLTVGVAGHPVRDVAGECVEHLGLLAQPLHLLQQKYNFILVVYGPLKFAIFIATIDLLL